MIQISKKISTNSKILSLVVVSSLCVLSFSLYISQLSRNTKQQLELIGSQGWPVLDKTKRLQYHFDHLVEEMHQAVTSHEKENLFQAESERIAMYELINDLTKMQPQFKDRGVQLQKLVTVYFNQTHKVSQALINNAKDASQQLILEQDNIKENAIRISDALQSWNSQAEKQFTSSLTLSELSAQTTSNVAIFGSLLIFLLGLLTYWTYRSNLINPIQKLTKWAKKIHDGRSDRGIDKDLIVHNNEFSQLALAIKNLVESLQLSNRELTDKNEKLIASTKAKSVFLANMSHEIRTPLASIIGFSEELLEDQNMPLEQRRAALSTVIQGGNHLRNIINDILDISKIEADKLQIKLSPVRLVDLISEIRDLISLQSTKKGLEFSVEFQNSIPKMIDTDALRLKQILLNLCSNACKFSDLGKVTLKIEYSDLTNMLSFTVRDNGIGISADELPHVFDEFYQADSSASRKYGGTGLGLPISKKLANMMEGDITAESEFGKGSTFILKINAGNSALEGKIHNVKLNAPVIPNAELAQLDDLRSDNPSPDRIKVLLAEDTPDNQRLISMFLKRYNIDLVIVDNGKKAVEEAQKNKYDLLLMDIQMPYMNGIEATEMLLKSGYEKPIIAVTANAMQDDISLYNNVGFAHVVAKPIVKRLLIEAIAKYVDKEVKSIDPPKSQLSSIRNQRPETASYAPAPVSIVPATTSTNNADVLVIRNIINQLKQLEQTLTRPETLATSNTNTTEETNQAEQKNRDLEPVVSTLFEDDPELLSLLNKYLDDLKIADKDIAAAYQAEDWERLKSLMHKVKGTGGAFGYPYLSEIAKEIHQQLIDTNAEELAFHMREFHHYCQRIFLGYDKNKEGPSNQQATGS